MATAEVGSDGFGAAESGPTDLLQAAARLGDVEKVNATLDCGADVNAWDQWGLTALHSAAIGGYTSTCALLLKNRASIDAASSRGQTALHLAAAGVKEETVMLLLESSADVALPSAHGFTALELVQRVAKGGSCEEVIRKELFRRWEQSDTTFQDLQRQMEEAQTSRRLLEEQLSRVTEKVIENTQEEGEVPESDHGCNTGVDPAAPPPDGGEYQNVASPGQNFPRKGSKVTPLPIGTAMDYWRTVAGVVDDVRQRSEEALTRARLRELPSRGSTDPFPWGGKLVSANSLPPPDPSDAELVHGFQWLESLAEEVLRQKERRGEPEAPPCEIKDKAMRDRTTKTQKEWDEFVRELKANGGKWDWAKVEVRARGNNVGTRDGASSGTGLGLAGVFAAGNREVAIHSGEVIGPLSGILRRKSHYEKLYYPGQMRMLQEPLGYALKLRVQTTEFKMEPLVLDLGAGDEQNRLRYIADIRPDPLQLRSLGLDQSVAATPRPLLPPRRQMPRPRSRPTSPDGSADGERVSQRDSPKYGLEESELGAPTALLAEVLVDGWPYIFIVATRDIRGGEELTVDYGEEHWATQRAMLTRLMQIGRLAHEVVTMVGAAPSAGLDGIGCGNVVEEAPLVLPPRASMRRALPDWE